MAMIPPSCFDYTFANSGVPVYYGGATAGRTSPNVGTRTRHRTNDITTMQASGSLYWYYNLLDGRYDTPPSGWNA